MKVKNVNKSSINTKAQIKKAFVELIHEKKRIHDISVSELVRKVGINRSTFYTHYSDLFSVAADIESEVSKAVLDVETETKEDALNYIEYVCKTFYAHRQMYQLLLTSYESLKFLAKLRQEVYGKLLTVYEKYSEDRLISFRLAMFMDGMADQLIRYFKNKSAYDYDELTKNFVYCASKLFD